MENNLREILKKSSYQPEEGLGASIWNKLVARDKYVTRIKFGVFTFAGLTSFLGLIPAFRILSSDIAHSGFAEYFSLIFSDGGSILTYWKEFSLSLAESLPVASAVLTLSLLFIFFLSLRHLAKQIGNGHLINSVRLSI